MEILIKNGLVVGEKTEEIRDIHISREKIINIGESLDGEFDKIIDAEGKVVIPGGVDAHTHFDIEMGAITAKDDFYTGTVAAACGGTTTIIDHMGFGPKGCSLMHQLEVYHGKSKDKAVIDYGFHGVIQEVNEDRLNELEIMKDLGVSSFKYYMTYDYKLEDREAYRLMKKVEELDVVLAVHAENNELIEERRKNLKEIGKINPKYHPESRPEECEAEAVCRVVNIASLVGNPKIYIVHLSNGKGMRYIQEELKRKNNIYTETCPQYLFLDKTLYLKDDATKYILCPPLRDKENQEELWKGIQKGIIKTIGTDHCSFDYEGDKKLGQNNFMNCPNGMPGVENRVVLMYSEGVEKNRIDIRKFTDIISTNPAKIFGVYPQKGVIKVGSDADIVIIDPNYVGEISHKYMHENVDYTPYEGIKIKGKIDITISRGCIIYDGKDFIGQKGRGKYLKRGITVCKI